MQPPESKQIAACQAKLTANSPPPAGDPIRVFSPQRYFPLQIDPREQNGYDTSRECDKHDFRLLERNCHAGHRVNARAAWAPTSYSAGPGGSTPVGLRATVARPSPNGE